MTSLPASDLPDVTHELLRDPYRHILSRTRALGTAGFRTRFLGHEAVCLTGVDAARLVYDPKRFHRQGAVPAVASDVLFGKGGVQGLDGVAHRHRKSLFLGLMGPRTDLDPVERRFADECRRAAECWRGEVDLFEQTKLILTRVAFEWAGVRLDQDRIGDISGMLSDLFLHAGPAPVGQIRARTSRHRLETMLAGTVGDLRGGKVEAADDSALSVIALWRDDDGTLLPEEIAAVELLNVLRPTVAISVYLVFLAHALSRHPASASRVAQDEEWCQAFVQEVRRTYPFFPATAAITNVDIDWHGEVIEAGTRVILDLYGTNRDAAHWGNPDRFSPERFLGWPGDPFTLIPQGGGDHKATHRCPGEWLTIRLMKRFSAMLTRDLEWRSATPDAEPDYSALPALPAGGFRITDTRLIGENAPRQTSGAQGSWTRDTV